MQGIKDKKVLITAGAAGLGKATAIAMMNAGAQLQQTFAGELDFLVNNAGTYGPAGPLETLDIDAWKATFDVNLHGTFYVSKYAIPLLKKHGGAIMNLSSTAGLYGYPMRSPYACAK